MEKLFLSPDETTFLRDREIDWHEITYRNIACFDPKHLPNLLNKASNNAFNAKENQNG
jgi:hypothetical protein